MRNLLVTRYFNVQVVGEAAYKITKDYCAKHPKEEWKDIIALRHVLVHDYYRINFAELWTIIHEELPPLREQIAAYIAEFPEDDE